MIRACIVLLFLCGCKPETENKTKVCHDEVTYYPSPMKTTGMCQDLGAGVYFCMDVERKCKKAP